MFSGSKGDAKGACDGGFCCGTGVWFLGSNGLGAFGPAGGGNLGGFCPPAAKISGCSVGPSSPPQKSEGPVSRPSMIARWFGVQGGATVSHVGSGVRGGAR